MKNTITQLNKLYPEKYIMVTYEFGMPVYLAPLGSNMPITDSKEEAEEWSYVDTLSSKLDYAKITTGYNKLQFEKK